jgi:hypothetical protein
MLGADSLGRARACPRSSWDPCDRKHAGQITAQHHRQLAIHIGEAGGTLVPWLGERSMGGFAEKLRCTRTEPLHCFKGDCAERMRISRAVMIHEMVPSLLGTPRFRYFVAWPGEHAAERVYEAARGWMKETFASTARSLAEVAVKVPA